MLSFAVRVKMRVPLHVKKHGGSLLPFFVCGCHAVVLSHINQVCLCLFASLTKRVHTRAIWDRTHGKYCKETMGNYTNRAALLCFVPWNQFEVNFAPAMPTLQRCEETKCLLGQKIKTF